MKLINKKIIKILVAFNLKRKNMIIKISNKIIILILFILKFESTKETLNDSNQRRQEDEKRFIECLENNSLTSCLILLFINERQEKLLLQVQNELSKLKISIYLISQNLIN